MKAVRILLYTLLISIGSAHVCMATETLPEPLTNEKLEALLVKADQAYNAGQYAEAYRLFRHELAVRGNEYGQYMTGFILYNGQDVDADPITGVAWMKLAANRGNLKLAQAAKKAYKSLDPVQQKGSDAAYARLVDTYGDCALLAARIEQLEDSISPQTGSRITENLNRITVMYQYGEDQDYQQRQMKIRETLKAQRKAYRNECR